MTEVLCRAFSITHLQVWGAVGPEGPANEDMRNGNNYFLSCGTTPFQMRTFILEAYREHCAGIHIACNSQSFINKAYQEMVTPLALTLTASTLRSSTPLPRPHAHPLYPAGLLQLCRH